jgi:LPS-assembly lipoprotein
MWSSEGAARVALLVALVLLTACGFRPLYGEGDGRGERIRAELAAIEVSRLEERLGQILRGALIDELDPTGEGEPARYDLIVGLTRTSNALAIQLDATITRYDMVLRAPYALRRRADGAVLHRGTVRRVASYNVRREPYATLVAEQDAERRAAREVAREIASLLALHFSREAEPEG